MTDDSEMILTLRFAASVCREIAAADTAADAEFGLYSIAAVWETIAADITAATGVDPAGEAELASLLGDWRGGTSAADVAGAIADEIRAIAGRLYLGDQATTVKALLEQLMEEMDGRPPPVGPGDRRIADPTTDTEAAGFEPERIASTSAHDDEVQDERISSESPDVIDEREIYPVWFATNRAPLDPADTAKGFSGRRSVDGVRHGMCNVHVPKSHRIGSLGSRLLRRIGRGEDRLNVNDITGFPASEFWERIGVATNDGERGRHAVVFIHGYNVSFVDAAMRAAQLGTDLGVRGPMTFFSWPSKGRFYSYLADSNSIEASAGAIVDYLVSMTTQPQFEAVHVIAHSMGNRGVLAAVSRIAAEAERLSGRRFGQFVLAAADVDAEVFREGVSAYASTGTAATLYVSPRDNALRLSELISAFPRAGRVPPVQVVNGVDTIDAGDIDVSSLGHGYFAETAAVLKDIHELLSTGRRPSERFGLAERRDEKGQIYWAFKP